MLKKLFKQTWSMWEDAKMKLTDFLNTLDENIQIGLTFVENGIYYFIDEDNKSLLDKDMFIKTSQLPIKEQIKYLKKGNFTISKISSIFWEKDFIQVVLQSN
mgnify:CR=1 FL=1